MMGEDKQWQRERQGKQKRGKQKREREIRFSLGLKFIAGLSIMSICIIASAIVAGIYTYKGSIAERYNNMAYQVAKTAEGYFTKEEIAGYADTVYRYEKGDASAEEIEDIVKSARYQEILGQLDKLRASMAANDIYVCAYDMDILKNYDREADAADEWKPLYYIADSYHIPEEKFKMGGKSSVFEEYVGDVIKACETGSAPDNYFIAEGAFGYNTSAVYPVVQDGRTVALIGVEIPMETLREDIRKFVHKIMFAGISVALLLLLLFNTVLTRILVGPVRRIANAAGEFVMNGNSIRGGIQEIRTHDEIQVLSQSILKMEEDINTYIANLTKVTAEKERIGAELDIATNIQKSMLPCIFPAFPDRKEIDIYAAMDPAKEVGGDFYDFFMIDDRHLVIVVADVSGKGIPAALFMVIGKTLIKDHTQLHMDLGKVFTEVNDLLCESNSEGLFITAFEGVLDLATGEFRFVNAGHETPFICKRGGRFLPRKIPAGFVLAGMEGMEYRCGRLQLEPGDKIFQYTDGVTEATDRAERLYGMERLERILGKCAAAEPREVLRMVRADIDAFVGDAPQFDDITMLCLEYKERMQA